MRKAYRIAPGVHPSRGSGVQTPLAMPPECAPLRGWEVLEREKEDFSGYNILRAWKERGGEVLQIQGAMPELEERF
jgi:hypothetical protein